MGAKTGLTFQKTFFLSLSPQKIFFSPLDPVLKKKNRKNPCRTREKWTVPSRAEAGQTYGNTWDFAGLMAGNSALCRHFWGTDWLMTRLPVGSLVGQMCVNMSQFCFCWHLHRRCHFWGQMCGSVVQVCIVEGLYLCSKHFSQTSEECVKWSKNPPEAPKKSFFLCWCTKPAFHHSKLSRALYVCCSNSSASKKAHNYHSKQ